LNGLKKAKSRVEIAPALLCRTKKELVDKLRRIEPFAKRAQVDIMDNEFVPNKTVQPKELKGLKTTVKLEAQLMVKDPLSYVSDCCRMGAWLIIVHYEALKAPWRIKAMIAQIRAHGKKVGIAINPETPASAIRPLLKLVDLALVMTVKPGFGGQKLIPATLKKVKQLRTWAPKLDIEVDGGINKDTARAAVRAGANVLVAGNAILKAPSVKEGIAAIRRNI
jgi:ribulose-phosphate 3-epimerase